MTVTRPEDINARFARGFNERDLDGLLALFDPTAVVVERDGAVRTGIDGVEEHLRGLLTLPGTMRSINHATTVAGDLALLTARWAIRGGDDEVVAAATSAEVLTRRPDGSWVYLVDRPFAAGPDHVA